MRFNVGLECLFITRILLVVMNKSFLLALKANDIQHLVFMV